MQLLEEKNLSAEILCLNLSDMIGLICIKLPFTSSLQFYESEFMELTVLCPAVIICRCSPTQKADVVRLLSSYAKKRTCAIGDGGNDVSMIQV